ncbi:MAG: tyramine oxidase, partial [Actinomycetota bacterium]|nr:tyramine oxidase [Actinomycetota bacterium]
MSAHPLDPLTADEIRRVVAVLQRDKAVDESWRFASIELREPAKKVVRDYDPTTAGTPPREARVICWSRVEQVTYKALVSLSDDAVLSWVDIPGEQPNMTIDEWHEAQHAALDDREVVAALAKRGITDLTRVLMDTWTYAHSLIPEEYVGRRLGWTDIWLRGSETGNPYAHPVNGLHVILDMNTMEVLRVEDSFSVELPDVMGEYVPALVPGLVQRPDIKPLMVHQPEGASLTVDGNAVRWQRWSMRIGFNYREGLVIHRVTYDDDGMERPVAHRLSFAEMIVPY